MMSKMGQKSIDQGRRSLESEMSDVKLVRLNADKSCQFKHPTGLEFVEVYMSKMHGKDSLICSARVHKVVLGRVSVANIFCFQIVSQLPCKRMMQSCYICSVCRSCPKVARRQGSRMSGLRKSTGGA